MLDYKWYGATHTRIDTYEVLRLVQISVNLVAGFENMGEIQKYSLIDELKKADENLQGSPSLLGMTSL